jgi:DNA-directed RNA polymerase specialized sigma24 family protein
VQKAANRHLNSSSCVSFSVEQVYLVAKKVVGKMIARKALPHREREDTEQELMRKFLEKQSKIEKAFQGNANSETYLTAILYRMCCEVIRSDVKDWDHVRSDDPSYFFSRQNQNSSVENKLVISNESAYLKKILLLFADESAKIVLFLKVLFGLTITESDLEDYNPDFRSRGIDEVLLGKQFKRNTDVYDALAEVVKLGEGSAVGGDAVRIWLNKRMDQTIKRLNGTMQRSNYDRKSFRILFDYTFSED